MKSTNLGSLTSFSISLFSLKFCSRTASMTSNSMSPNTPSGLGPGSFRERSGCNKHSWLEDPILHRSFKYKRNKKKHVVNSFYYLIYPCSRETYLTNGVFLNVTHIQIISCKCSFFLFFHLHHCFKPLFHIVSCGKILLDS